MDEEDDKPPRDLLGTASDRVWSVLDLPAEYRDFALDWINRALGDYLDSRTSKAAPATDAVVRAQITKVFQAAKALRHAIDDMAPRSHRELYEHLEMAGMMLEAGLNGMPDAANAALGKLRGGRTGRSRAAYWGLADSLARIWLMNPGRSIDQSTKRGSFRHFAETICEVLPAKTKPNWGEIVRRRRRRAG